LPPTKLRTALIAAYLIRLQQGFETDEMGFGVKLHSSNSEPSMSALGQKRTLARH